jgi:hypothetical protein
MVIAHILPELVASIGVLRSTGFSFDGPGNDPHEPAAIRYVLPRERYEQLHPDHSRSGSPAARVSGQSVT